MSNKNKLIISGLAGVTLAGALGVGILMIERIPAGYVGVVHSPSKGVENTVLDNGWHFISPIKKVSLFNISTEVVYMSKDEREGSKEDESINIATKDGMLSADLTYNYNFSPTDVVKVQKKFRGKDGETIVNTILRGQMRSWISEVTKNYSTMECHLTKKEEVNSKLTEAFNKKGEQYGLKFDNVSIAETRPPEEVKKALEERQKLDQELEKNRAELEKVEIAKQKAQLEAERKVIEAEGEKKANAIKAEGLDNRILKEMAIEKWDGKLPQVNGGNAITDLR